MNSLHKKREAFRQAIRSKSIQDIFRRKRQELLEQLKQTMQTENHSMVTQTQHHWQTQTKFSHSLGMNLRAETYEDVKKLLTQIDHQIQAKEQQHILVLITESHSFKGIQKIDLLSRLINRKQFSLDSKIQLHYGWKKLIQDFLNIIQQTEQQKRDTFENAQKYQFLIKQQSNTNSKVQTIGLKNMLCFSLIKIWQSKPKTQYFLIFTKIYHLFYQKISNTLSLTLIAELSYDRVLVPNSQFISKLFQVNIDKLTEVKFFRTIQILKNFLFHFRVDNSQIHARQLIFEYINWIKIQINLILSTYEVGRNQYISTNNDTALNYEMEFETRYCLIYLLFATLNKLFEVNEMEKQHLDAKEILILNEEILSHTQNHTTMKFMIQEGKAATEGHHKNNILRTLTFFINFLQVSTRGKGKEQNNLGAQLEQIEITFQGTELNWFQSFN